MSADKKFAPACERNQAYILDIFKRVFTRPGRVLEIGSGTGQHAAYFASHLPHLQWCPTDLSDNLPSIDAYRREAKLPNLLEPEILDLSATENLQVKTDYLVCINAIHIVSWPLVESLFELGGRLLESGGVFYCYGPYRYEHRPLEPSNEQFDRILKMQNPDSGIRVFEDVNRLAAGNGLQLQGDASMPANNRSLWWRMG